MPYFGKTSKRRLATCHPELIRLFEEVITVVDCSIICGHRGKRAQDRAFNSNNSQVRYPNSKHNINPSGAIDVAPYYPGTKIRWKDAKGFIHFAGVVRGIAHALEIKIRWGGDWDGDFDLLDQKFNDLAHYELIL